MYCFKVVRTLHTFCEAVYLFGAQLIKGGRGHSRGREQVLGSLRRGLSTFVTQSEEVQFRIKGVLYHILPSK